MGAAVMLMPCCAICVLGPHKACRCGHDVIRPCNGPCNTVASGWDDPPWRRTRDGRGAPCIYTAGMRPCVRPCVRVCVRACVRASIRVRASLGACVRAGVLACVRAYVRASAWAVCCAAYACDRAGRPAARHSVIYQHARQPTMYNYTVSLHGVCLYTVFLYIQHQCQDVV